MKPDTTALQALIALVRARCVVDRLAYWLACQPDIDRAWARVPRLDWLQFMAKVLCCDQSAIDAANEAAEAVGSADIRGSELTERELRCAAFRRHVTAQVVAEALERARQAAEGEVTKVRAGSGVRAVVKGGWVN